MVKISGINYRVNKNKIDTELKNVITEAVKSAFEQYYLQDNVNNSIDIETSNKNHKKLKKLTKDNEELANENYELTKKNEELMNNIHKLQYEKECIQAKIKEYEYEIENYRNKPIKYLSRIKECKAELVRVEDELDNVNETNKNLLKEVKSYQLKYKNIEEVYNDYISIDEEIKNGFKNLIDTKNIIAFIISGTDSDNLRFIWERIGIYIEKYDKDTIGKLKRTFDLFFEIFNSVHHLYTRIDTSIGDKFDMEIHSKVKDSKVSGAVTEVLFEGYTNVKTGKIEKSIVRI